MKFHLCIWAELNGCKLGKIKMFFSEKKINTLGFCVAWSLFRPLFGCPFHFLHVAYHFKLNFTVYHMKRGSVFFSVQPAIQFVTHHANGKALAACIPMRLHIVFYLYIYICVYSTVYAYFSFCLASSSIIWSATKTV